MRRINTLNKATDAFGPGKHGWKNGVPGTVNRPTEGQAEWFNAIQEELAHVLESRGVALDPDNLHQLGEALAGGGAFSPAGSYPDGTLAALMKGNGSAGSFRSQLLLAGNGPWANPASGDTQHLFELVNDNTGNQCFAMTAYGASTNGNNFHCNRSFGTLAAPAPITSGAGLLSMGFRGWDGSGTLSQSMAAHQVYTTENWTPGAHGIKFHWELAKTGGATSRLPAMDLYSGLTDSVVLQLGDGSSLTSRILSASTTGATQIHGSSDQNGAQAVFFGSAHATNASQALLRANMYRFQNVAGTDWMVLDASANLLVGTSSGSAHTLYKAVANDAGNAVLLLGNTGNASAFYGVSGSGANSANAALRILKDATTNRSINGAGTINASGADYAEYMRKAPGCGSLAKGAVVGVDGNGMLTDKWADAISFLVKSTDPSYVGGDTWGHEDALGIPEPVEPVFVRPEYTGSERPADIPMPPEDYSEPAPAPTELVLPRDIAAAAAINGARQAQYQDYLVERANRIAAHDATQQAFDAALAKFNADIEVHAKAVYEALAAFEAGPQASYRKALAEFRAAHETARQTVDRMAFAGQVPVNVLGAKPGDYIVPAQDGDGIKGVAVTKPTFEQYQAAVGRVIAIEVDGRARLVVKAA